MIEVIEQTADRAKLDHDLIVPITRLGHFDHLESTSFTVLMLNELIMVALGITTW